MGGGNNPQALVLLGVVSGDRDGIVGGAVVPDEEFKVGMGLGENALDRGRQISGAIVNWNDEGDRKGHKLSDNVRVELLVRVFPARRFSHPNCVAQCREA